MEVYRRKIATQLTFSNSLPNIALCKSLIQQKKKKRKKTHSVDTKMVCLKGNRIDKYAVLFR